MLKYLVGYERWAVKNLLITYVCTKGFYSCGVDCSLVNVIYCVKRRIKFFSGSAGGKQLILSKITVIAILFLCLQDVIKIIKNVNLRAKNRLYHWKREFIQVASNIAFCGLSSHAGIAFLVPSSTTLKSEKKELFSEMALLSQ